MTSNNSTATALATEGLTQNELRQARVFLQQTQNAVAGSIKGLTEEQWNFKPAADQWSIGENLEHILIVQERVLGPVLSGLAQAPAPPAGRDYARIDEIVIHHFPTRLAKFQSPEGVQPTGALKQADAQTELERNFVRYMEVLEFATDLRQHAIDAPPLKAITGGVYEQMDGYQWILAAAAHTERHTKQILEVKADTNFPAN